MTKRESSLLWSLERGLGIALQAMQEKKAVMSRGSPGCRELHHRGDFLTIEVCEQDRPNTAIDVFQQEKGGIGKFLFRPEKDDRN